MKSRNVIRTDRPQPARVAFARAGITGMSGHCASNAGVDANIALDLPPVGTGLPAQREYPHHHMHPGEERA